MTRSLDAGIRKSGEESVGWLSAYAPRLERLALRLTGDPESACDIRQVVLLKIAARGEEFADRNPSAMLYRMVLNAARDRHRGEEARRRHETSVRGPSAAPDPSEVSAAREMRDSVVRAVAELPLDEREVLILKHFEDLPFARVADILEIPVSTAKSRLARALDHLRPLLKENAP